jgi:hypothetical protein
MRTYTLAGLVILLIVGCTPEGEGEGGDATQGDATSPRDVSADSSSDILPSSVPLGEACGLDTHCREAEGVCKSGICTVVACDTADQCEGKQICDYYCIRSVGPDEICSRDEACPPDYICDSLHCKQRACESRSDCGNGRACSPEGFCNVPQCSTHEDCPQDGGRMGCFNEWCQQPLDGRCLEATDCGAGEDCNLLTNKCYSP